MARRRWRERRWRGRQRERRRGRRAIVVAAAVPACAQHLGILEAAQPLRLLGLGDLRVLFLQPLRALRLHAHLPLPRKLGRAVQHRPE